MCKKCEEMGIKPGQDPLAAFPLDQRLALKLDACLQIHSDAYQLARTFGCDPATAKRAGELQELLKALVLRHDMQGERTEALEKDITECGNALLKEVYDPLTRNGAKLVQNALLDALLGPAPSDEDQAPPTGRTLN